MIADGFVESFIVSTIGQMLSCEALIKLSSRLSKLLFIHAAYYLINVGCRQVGVALRHFGGLVAQHFADG